MNYIELPCAGRSKTFLEESHKAGQQDSKNCGKERAPLCPIGQSASVVHNFARGILTTFS